MGAAGGRQHRGSETKVLWVRERTGARLGGRGRAGARGSLEVCMVTVTLAGACQTVFPAQCSVLGPWGPCQCALLLPRVWAIQASQEVRGLGSSSRLRAPTRRAPPPDCRSRCLPCTCVLLLHASPWALHPQELPSANDRWALRGKFPAPCPSRLEQPDAH